MAKNNRRGIVFVILTLIALSLTCGGFNSQGSNLTNEARNMVFPILGGSHTVEAIPLQESLCDPGHGAQSGRTETLELVENTLVIRDENGPRTYLHQGEGAFCRLRAAGEYECISNFSEASYSVTIYTDQALSDVCYWGVQVLTRVSPPVAAPAHEPPPEEEAPPEGGDDQPDPVDPGGEPPGETAPEDLGDAPAPDACYAYPEDYTWSYLDTTKEAGSRGWRCLGTFELKNTGPQPLIVYAFKTSSTGADGQQYAGWGAGGRILQPGEGLTEGINYTAYDDGGLTFLQFTKLLVLYDDNACRWLDPRTVDPAQLAGEFIPLFNPCLFYVPEGYPLGAGHFDELNDLMLGAYLAALTTNVENGCSPGEAGAPGRSEQFAFEANVLTVTDGNGTRTFTHQGGREYCRERADGTVACLSGISPSGYAFKIYPDASRQTVCFDGQQDLTRVE